ncbi:GGDEF domain-containing protein [Pseudomonas citronellolis]|uniref:GGDEF domain-containing protein n=1 Tax=Pseudomonas citronellolis TaxID=53408 RepID=UPI0023E3C1AB|nr:sensor domain-containing diguanylate cyclase [Pseudomonas citronellolis]MDF3931172.1 sensor domain-containing diguanylate cyclase [Pseudomonas citronellolis]
MKRRGPWPVDLRGLVLIIVLLSVLATFCNSLLVAYRVQRDALIHSTLEANAAYAAKVASSIGEFLRSAHKRLAYSASRLGQRWDDPRVLREEAVRLQAQDADFNSIAIVDATGKVLQAYPDALQIVGETLRSEGVTQALKERRPLVSAAYVSIAGNLVVFISQPVFGADGSFLGVVGGSVYLRKQSALHAVIGSHFHHEGTFAFIADGHRRLLYHPDAQRIGEVLGASMTVDAALKGESGSLAVPNYRGVDMLAGYAPVTDANWAVVAQQPRARSLAPLAELMRDMVVGMLPAGLLGLLLIGFGVALIARPLRQLSDAAEQLAAPQTVERLQNIHAWYHDASAIRQALLTGVQLFQQRLGRLSREAQSDPLTGLANRRALGAMLDLLAEAGQGYAVLALDIDHFKRVNDSFGHDAGDVALKQVAEILRRNSRSGDLACRAGGEEFTLILPDTPMDTARAIAERIRENLAGSEVPQVGRLTLSIGVACQGPEAPTAEAVLKLADERLYRAKQEGRNRVVG